MRHDPSDVFQLCAHLLRAAHEESECPALRALALASALGCVCHAYGISVNAMAGVTRDVMRASQFAAKGSGGELN